MFGTVIERHFWKKNPKWRHSWDFVNEIVADRMLVELSYDTYFKFHMPIQREIRRSVQKYMPFSGPSPCDFREKNPKHRNIYKMMQHCALDSFLETRQWRSRARFEKGLITFKIFMVFVFWCCRPRSSLSLFSKPRASWSSLFFWKLSNSDNPIIFLVLVVLIHGRPGPALRSCVCLFKLDQSKGSKPECVRSWMYAGSIRTSNGLISNKSYAVKWERYTILSLMA